MLEVKLRSTKLLVSTSGVLSFLIICLVVLFFGLLLFTYSKTAPYRFTTTMSYKIHALNDICKFFPSEKPIFLHKSTDTQYEAIENSLPDDILHQLDWILTGFSDRKASKKQHRPQHSLMVITEIMLLYIF